jgi:hypothetical protein
MSPILERVHELLTDLEIQSAPRGDGEALAVSMRFTHCSCNLVFRHDPGSDQLALIAFLPSNVPANRRAAVAEFLTRLNWNLTGHLYLMDWKDGEVRLRQDMPLYLPALPSKKAIAFWFHSACVMADGFYPALMNVIYRGMPPVQALEQGEADYREVLKNHCGDENNTD